MVKLSLIAWLAIFRAPLITTTSTVKTGVSSINFSVQRRTTTSLSFNGGHQAHHWITAIKSSILWGYLSRHGTQPIVAAKRPPQKVNCNRKNNFFFKKSVIAVVRWPSLDRNKLIFLVVVPVKRPPSLGAIWAVSEPSLSKINNFFFLFKTYYHWKKNSEKKI